MVEDVPIGEASEDKVEGKDAYQGYHGKGYKLAGNVVARPCREDGGVMGGWKWWMGQEGDEVTMPRCWMVKGEGERNRSQA